MRKAEMKNYKKSYLVMEVGVTWRREERQTEENWNPS